MSKFNSISELMKHLQGGDVTIVGDDWADQVQTRRTRPSRPTPTWTDEEKKIAPKLQELLDDGTLIWWVARPTVFTKTGQRYEDFIACYTDTGVYSYSLNAKPYERITGTKQDDYWTKPEMDFYHVHLLPLLDAGVYTMVIPQVTIHMLGQSVTCDFVAYNPKDGLVDHFEVKGGFALGSQGRASVKYRWLKSWLVSLGSKHRIHWATVTDGGIKVREITVKRKKHPMLKGERK